MHADERSREQQTADVLLTLAKVAPVKRQMRLSGLPGSSSPRATATLLVVIAPAGLAVVRFVA